MSLERVAELGKLIEQAKTMRARAEGAVEIAQQAREEALSRLKALGVESADEALTAAAEARKSLQTAIGKIETKLKEALRRD